MCGKRLLIFVMPIKTETMRNGISFNNSPSIDPLPNDFDFDYSRQSTQMFGHAIFVSRSSVLFDEEKSNKIKLVHYYVESVLKLLIPCVNVELQSCSMPSLRTSKCIDFHIP